jgi:hypothetical protein
MARFLKIVFDLLKPKLELVCGLSLAGEFETSEIASREVEGDDHISLLISKHALGHLALMYKLFHHLLVKPADVYSFRKKLICNLAEILYLVFEVL